ncbi:MAG TPA: adenosylcobinamide-GDP ribazoletransferase [Oscillospiraceae bacterium]|nr:adenosylcobinamide-GDP ribazoletransferase [Oscillospiraceae bacterium]
MKKVLSGMGMASAMYSKIPMPDWVWKYGTPALTFCFFPMVGMVSGGMLLGWLLLAQRLGISAFLQGTGCVLISVLVSGAIHFDGFCDTWDALGSHQSREKKLEILKDSHIGAFAAIYGALYLLVAAAFWGEVEVDLRTAGVLACIPVLGRALSGLSAVTFKNARGTGLLATFSDAADTKTVRIACFLWILVSAFGMLRISPMRGAAVLLAAGIVFLHYRRMSYREFGGITGDLAGYFLTLCEASAAVAVVAVQKLEVLL